MKRSDPVLIARELTAVDTDQKQQASCLHWAGNPLSHFSFRRTSADLAIVYNVDEDHTTLDDDITLIFVFSSHYQAELMYVQHIFSNTTSK